MFSCRNSRQIMEEIFSLGEDAHSQTARVLDALASHFMLALLPASLQLLPVIVELLQTHDPIL